MVRRSGDGVGQFKGLKLHSSPGLVTSFRQWSFRKTGTMGTLLDRVTAGTGYWPCQLLHVA